jgi:hypothetical protein
VIGPVLLLQVGQCDGSTLLERLRTHLRRRERQGAYWVVVRDFVGRDVDEDRLAAEVVRRTAEEEEEEDPPRCSVGVRVLATANCSPRWRTAERETRSDCGGWRVADWLRGRRGDGSRLRRGWTVREGRFVVDRVGDTAHTVVVVVVVAERRAASSPALRGAFRRRVVEAGRVASGVRR